MTSSFSVNKGLEEPASGDYVNAWATPVNANWTAIDAALGGTTSISVTGISAPTTNLTLTQYRPPNIDFTGILGANLTYQIPTGVGGMWSIKNATTGAFTLTFSIAAGNSLTLDPGRTLIISDGVTVALANPSLTQQPPYYIATPQELAVSATIVNFTVPPNYVTRYGSNTTPGFTDMTAAVLTAVSVAQASVNDRWVHFPPGTYLTSGINLSGTLQSIKFSGDGAILTTISNAPIFTQNTSDDLEFTGLYFTGNAGDNFSALQYGIYQVNHSRTRVINCHFENLASGVYNQNALTGLLTGAVQIPSQISGNTFKNCFNGIFLQDDGVSDFGEYTRISDNTFNDCQNWAILDHAGNTAIVGNTGTGNGGGILIDSIGATNGDHGLIVGNTFNHNFRANLYIRNTLRSQIVTGNNFWACLSGALGTGYLNGSFGVYLDTCSSIIFTNNVLGRNSINIGTNALQFCVIAHNEFLTDPANTTAQWIENTVYGSPNFNFYGPNNFTGSFTGGGLVGNPNGDFSVAVTAGAPAFTNGWANLGGAFGTVKFWKDSENVVHLSGIMQSGTLGLQAFQLPATMRPADGTRNFAVFSNGAFGYAQITTSGSVIPAAGSNTSFALDGISFRAGAVAP